MAGRRACTNVNAAVAVAMAVALLALLFAAGEAGDCNVDQGKVVMLCAPACQNGGDPTPSTACCNALRGASSFDCLCDKYWSKNKNSPYASCAAAIPSKCSMPGARKSCSK